MYFQLIYINRITFRR